MSIDKKKLFSLFDGDLKSKNDLVASDPQNLETLSDNSEEQELIIKKIKQLDEVNLKIDYSNFSNFVFFNSALDYFNISAEKILNEYPYDSSEDSLEEYKNNLDGYQRYLLSSWPKRVGHLHFDTSISSSYIKIEDVGIENNITKSSFLSPGTGSFSIELWFNGIEVTGTEDVQVLAQKFSGSTYGGAASYGYLLYLTGSEVRFQFSSGSVTDEVSSSFSANSNQYIAAVVDRSSFTGSISIITGSLTEFPVLVNSSSLNFYTTLDLSNSDFTIGSGTLEGKTTQYFTGSIDEVIVWNKARTLQEISSSYNVKHFSQKNVVGLWRFNESGSISPDNGENSLVLDHSSHKLDGRILNYYTGCRRSGSMMLQEDPDPILFFDSPEIQSLITIQQTSGSDYDRANSNIITRLVPEEFLLLEDKRQTEVLKNFLYLLGRHYDSIKIYIDQFVNILSVNYGNYNQTPDELLDVVAEFFGWKFTGNFLNKEAFKYILGKNVLSNVNTNKRIEQSLYEIKNKFWRRVLLNLVHLYKTKGTKESVQSLLRLYGVNKNFVRLKEFGTLYNRGISNNRINSEKSEYALGFGSGSLTASLAIVTTGSLLLTQDFSIETRLKFPLTSSLDIQCTKVSGTIWSRCVGTDYVRLQYLKPALNHTTGTLILSSSDVNNILTASVPIFDNKWYNIAVSRDFSSSSLMIDVKSVDNGEIITDINVSLTGVNAGAITSSFDRLTFGSTSSIAPDLSYTFFAAEFWGQEFRFWNRPLNKKELEDHALNFQSYGSSDPYSDRDSLLINWKLRENVTASIDGAISKIEDVSLNENHGFGYGFNTSKNPYKKFLLEYNYLPSLDFGWNEDRVQYFDSSNIDNTNFVNDSRIVSLEFNMVDSLNEDIVQLFSMMDKFNEIFGLPANKYRIQYESLQALRTIYFNRLQGRLNFRLFADLIEFFDRSFINMVKRLIPARSIFIGDEFVVESHLLERPKITYERRKIQERFLDISGSIQAFSRF